MRAKIQISKAANELQEKNPELFNRRRHLIIDKAMIEAKGRFMTDEEKVMLHEVKKKIIEIDAEVERLAAQTK